LTIKQKNRRKSGNLQPGTVEAAARPEKDQVSSKTLRITEMQKKISVVQGAKVYWYSVFAGQLPVVTCAAPKPTGGLSHRRQTVPGAVLHTLAADLSQRVAFVFAGWR
jgi:hypothetical protein